MRRNYRLSIYLGLFVLALLPGCAGSDKGVPVSGAAGIDLRPTEDPVGISPEAYATAPTTMVRCDTFPVVVVWHQFDDGAVYDFVVDEDPKAPQLAFYLIIKKVGPEAELVTYQFLHTGHSPDIVHVVSPYARKEANRLAGAVLDLYLAPKAGGSQALKACNGSIREMHQEYLTRS